jgi:hypothetical protein
MRWIDTANWPSQRHDGFDELDGNAAAALMAQTRSAKNPNSAGMLPTGTFAVTDAALWSTRDF